MSIPYLPPELQRRLPNTRWHRDGIGMSSAQTYRIDGGEAFYPKIDAVEPQNGLKEKGNRSDSIGLTISTLFSGEDSKRKRSCTRRRIRVGFSAGCVDQEPHVHLTPFFVYPSHENMSLWKTIPVPRRVVLPVAGSTTVQVISAVCRFVSMLWHANRAS